jgi:hypothetical protein
MNEPAARRSCCRTGDLLRLVDLCNSIVAKGHQLVRVEFRQSARATQFPDTQELRKTLAALL